MLILAIGAHHFGVSIFGLDDHLWDWKCPSPGSSRAESSPLRGVSRLNAVNAAQEVEAPCEFAAPFAKHAGPGFIACQQSWNGERLQPLRELWRQLPPRLCHRTPSRAKRSRGTTATSEGV